MSNGLTTNNGGGALVPAAVEQALVAGDLSKLGTQERLAYYNSLCNSLGLNPLTKPFEYITLNGKLTLYARKDCTDQLRTLRGVSITDLSGQVVDDLYVVSAKGSDKSGRSDAATGAVVISGLRGEAKANAIMKAETKAKRRLTLSLCGLGMLDETEVDSIEGAKVHAPAVVAKPLNLAPVAPVAPVVEAKVEPVSENRPFPGDPWDMEPEPAEAPADLASATESLESFGKVLTDCATVEALVEAWGKVPKNMKPGLVKLKDQCKEALTRPKPQAKAEPKPQEAPATDDPRGLMASMKLVRKIQLAATKNELEGYIKQAQDGWGTAMEATFDNAIRQRQDELEAEMTRLSRDRSRR